MATYELCRGVVDEILRSGQLVPPRRANLTLTTSAPEVVRHIRRSPLGPFLWPDGQPIPASVGPPPKPSLTIPDSAATSSNLFAGLHTSAQFSSLFLFISWRYNDQVHQDLGLALNRPGDIYITRGLTRLPAQELRFSDSSRSPADSMQAQAFAALTQELIALG